MEKLKEVLRSGHVQIALATGISIIALAYVSKRVLPEPLSYLQLAFPPFLATVYEAFLGSRKYARFANTRYWVAAIFLATGLVMLTAAI